MSLAFYRSTSSSFTSAFQEAFRGSKMRPQSNVYSSVHAYVEKAIVA